MSKTLWIKILFLLLSFYLCHPAPAQERNSYLPDPKLTPGQTLDLTAADLCKPEYNHSVPNIPIAVKGQVLERYHITKYESGYNIDHLIPVKLGGSNAISNLWPQPLAGEWVWYRKNKLERRLRKLVCRGQLDLKIAQQDIATDWISAYKKYVGEPRRAPGIQP